MIASALIAATATATAAACHNHHHSAAAAGDLHSATASAAPAAQLRRRQRGKVLSSSRASQTDGPLNRPSRHYRRPDNLRTAIAASLLAGRHLAPSEPAQAGESYDGQ
ncbi:MAG TPA: hypothetical protein VGK29_09795 [Paludibaculum sp.]